MDLLPRLTGRALKDVRRSGWSPGPGPDVITDTVWAVGPLEHCPVRVVYVTLRGLPPPMA